MISGPRRNDPLCSFRVEEKGAPSEPSTDGLAREKSKDRIEENQRCYSVVRPTNREYTSISSGKIGRSARIDTSLPLLTPFVLFFSRNRLSFTFVIYFPHWAKICPEENKVKNFELFPPRQNGPFDRDDRASWRVSGRHVDCACGACGLVRPIAASSCPAISLLSSIRHL